MSELPTRPVNSPRSESDHIEARLDEAIEESFPASDSPAVSLSDDPPAGPHFENVQPSESAQPQARAVNTRGRSLLARLAPAAIATLGAIALIRFLKQRRFHRIQ